MFGPKERQQRLHLKRSRGQECVRELTFVLVSVYEVSSSDMHLSISGAGRDFNLNTVIG